MVKLRQLLLFIILFSINQIAFSYNGVWNPNTGRQDLVGSGTSGDMSIVCDSTSYLQTTGGGTWGCVQNVGIGTTLPAHKLDVVGTHRDTGYIGAARLANGFRETFVYDDFDRTDRTLNGDITPTGQTWQITGPGFATVAIVDGKMSSSTNVYPYLDYGTTLNRIDGTFSFVPGAGANDLATSNLCLIADSSWVSGLQTMLHMHFGPTQWTLQKRLSGGSFDVIAQGSYTIQTDGTVYPISMEISGNTCTVQGPDGKFTSVTDADIGTINPRFGVWQIMGNVNGYTGRWHSASIGKSKAQTLIAAGAAAPLTEVSNLKGAGVTMKKTVEATLSGGAGWYRIATASTLATFTISGQVRISATATSVGSGIDAYVRYLTGREDPIIYQNQFIEYNGPITQMRLSALTSSPYSIGLDIYNSSANPVTIRLDFDGYFTPISSPTVGAVAHADKATTYTFNESNMLNFSGGNVGIGTITPNSVLDVNGTARVLTSTTPGAGSGLEFQYLTGVGEILAYNRTSPGFLPIRLRGSTIDLDEDGNGSDIYITGGNVGIGTTNPAAKLQVDSRIFIGNPTVIDSYDQLYSAGSYPGFRQEVQRTWGGAAFDLFALRAHKTSAAGDALWGKIGMLGDFGADGVASTPTVDYMFFGSGSTVSYYDNTLRLYPDKRAYFDGNVGIGTTVPATLLNLSQSLNGGATALRIDNPFIGSASLDETTELQFYVGASPISKIVGVKTGDYYTNNVNVQGALAFYTQTSGASIGAFSEKMRIAENGNVGIGTTAPVGLLDVNKLFQVGSTGIQIQKALTQTYSGTKTLSDGSATALFQVTVGNGQYIGGNVTYSIYVTGGTSDIQAHSGEVAFVCVNKANTVTSDIEEQYAAAAEAEVLTAGTLTDAWTITDGAGVCTINLNADTNLSTPTLTGRYDVTLDSTNTLTPQ